MEKLRIRTPTCYPDGDQIDVFLTVRPESTWDGITFLMTDLGETIRWLTMMSWSDHAAANRDAAIAAACTRLGVTRNGGVLEYTVVTGDLKTQAAWFAQSCRAIAVLGLDIFRNNNE